MVQIQGFTQGFGQGMELGNQRTEIEQKREALKKEQINNQIKLASSSAGSLIKAAQEFITSAPNRNSPGFNDAVMAYRQPVEETASMLEQLGDPDAQQAAAHLRQSLNLTLDHAKTKSEAFTADIDATMEGVMGPGGGQAQAPSPMPMPQQPAPSPMMQPQPSSPMEVPPIEVPQMGGAGVAPGMGSSAEAAPPQVGMVGEDPNGRLPEVAQAAPPPAAATPAQTPVQPRQGPPLDWGEIPSEDIELLLADPNVMQEFQAEYGQDPNSILADPEEPGQEMSEKEIRMRAAKIDPFTPERKEMAKIKSKSYAENKATISEAKKTIIANHEARKLLDAGMFTGITGSIQLWLARAKLAMTDDPELAARVRNTEAYLAPITANVGRLIKMFGAGTGLSDTDREMAYKAAAGDLSLTEDSLRRILDINTRLSTWALRNPELAKPNPEALKEYQNKYGVQF